ncbi:glycosyltransferase [Motilimonas cestriensis]|uniref:Glycosyltransferase n=1 Tax=Motilimonas cestriensis TaxID=2742685 RepID=A0ABS8W843_9GAMM|nr:glycosyltransferase [Motilimonas cestriensis]MCE2594718.1 glycosyltransferase [Motilimonas cestriensis]
MNIQFVLKDFAKSGGVERIQYNLAKKFKSDGHDVSFYILNGDSIDLDPSKEFKTYKGSKTGLFSFFLEILKLRKNIIDNELDVVIGAKEQANLAIFFSSLFTKISAIYTRHSALNVSEQKINERSVLLIYSLLTLGKGKVVTVSHALKDSLVEGLPWGKKKIHVCPNPVITASIFEKAKIPLPGITLPDSYICTAGRLTRTKGYDLLIQAYSKCIKKNSNFPDLVIAGAGEEQDTLTSLVKELNIEKKVHFLGHVNNPYFVMKNSSGFVLSSRNEGLPTVLIEAIALGVNVVSVDCPTGPSEILDGGRIGQLVPVEDIQALADAMQIMPFKKLSLSDIAEMDRYSLEQSSISYSKLFRQKSC